MITQKSLIELRKKLPKHGYAVIEAELQKKGISYKARNIKRIMSNADNVNYINYPVIEEALRQVRIHERKKAKKAQTMENALKNLRKITGKKFNQKK